MRHDREERWVAQAAAEILRDFVAIGGRTRKLEGMFARQPERIAIQSLNAISARLSNTIKIVWTTMPMLKTIALAVVAVLCFASQSLARQPYFNDPIPGVPSVLIRADVPADAAQVEAATKLESSAPAAPVASDNAVVKTAPVDQPTSDTSSQASSMPATPAAVTADDSSTISQSMPIESSAPVYRSVQPGRRQTGLIDEIREFERRKNSWLRRTFIGR